MSTTAMPEVKKPTLMPKNGLNPVVAPNIVCQNRKCHALLAPERAEENPSNGQLEVIYHCENCNYDFHLSPSHAHGGYAAPGQKTKSLPEARG